METPTRHGDSGLADLTAQAQGKRLARFGQVDAVSLSSLELSTDTVGASLTAPSNAVLRVWRMGDGAWFGLDTYGRLTLGANATELRIRLPFGLRGGSRTPLSGGPESRQGIARAMIIDPTAGFVSGYLTIEGAFLKVTRDAVAAFNAGSVGVYGQIWSEIVRPDEA